MAVLCCLWASAYARKVKDFPYILDLKFKNKTPVTRKEQQRIGLFPQWDMKPPEWIPSPHIIELPQTNECPPGFSGLSPQPGFPSDTSPGASSKRPLTAVTSIAPTAESPAVFLLHHHLHHLIILAEVLGGP